MDAIAATLDQFHHTERIAVLRLQSVTAVVQWASQLHQHHGFTCFEVPFTVPNAEEAMKALAHLGQGHWLVGAGTVLTPHQLQQAIRAGARFAASPVTDGRLLAQAETQGCLLLPGAATPNELWHAHQLGARAIKWFPAQALGGAPALGQLLAPFPSLKVIPTGGIHLQDTAAYRQAGAWAVGMGPKALAQLIKPTE